METIFLVLFVLGLSFVVLSFLLGFAQAELHLPGLADGDLHHADGAADGDVSPLNVSTVMAFLTWFGGIGYLLSVQGMFGTLAILALSSLGGLVGAGIVFVVLVKFLLPGQTAYLREEDYRLEGTLGRVSLPMSGSRIGEVIFTQDGVTRSEGARSADGSPLPRGAEVVILRYERNIAYVEPLDKLLAERSTEGDSLREGEQRRLP